MAELAAKMPDDPVPRALVEVSGTLGQIGFAERSGYTAIGTVCNLATRLCAEAKDGQILLAQRLAIAVRRSRCSRSLARYRSRVSPSRYWPTTCRSRPLNRLSV
jgi:class 3 adenylate cyclase